MKAGGAELNVQLWDIAGQERFAGLSRVSPATIGPQPHPPSTAPPLTLTRCRGRCQIFYTHAVAAIIVYDITARSALSQSAISCECRCSPACAHRVALCALLHGLQRHIRQRHQVGLKSHDERSPLPLLEHRLTAVLWCLRCCRWKHDIDAKVFLPSGAKIPVLLLGNKSDLLDEGHTPCIPTAALDNFLSEQSFYAHFLCSAKTGVNVKEACTHLVAKIHSNNQSEMSAAAEGDGGKGPEPATVQAPIKLSEAGNTPEPKAGCC